MGQDTEEIPMDQFEPADDTSTQSDQSQSTPGEIPADQFWNEQNEIPPQNPELLQYQTPGQQALTIGENAAQGIAGPLATGAELGLSKLGVPGVSDEDIKMRQQANPGEALAGQMGGFGAGLFLGASEARAGMALADALTPEAASVMGKIGAKALNNAIQAGVFQASNEITKGLLGQGDPNHPVSGALINTGAAMVLGGGFGAATGTAGAALGKAGEYVSSLPKGQGKVPDFLHGIGVGTSGAWTDQEILQAIKDKTMRPSIANGAKVGMALKNKAVGAVTGAIMGHFVGKAIPIEEGPLKEIAQDALGGYLGEKYISPIMAPVLYHCLGSGPEGLGVSLKYAGRAMSGESQASKAVGNLFDYGTSKAIDSADPAKDIEKIKKFVDQGGVENQLYNTPNSAQEQPNNYVTYSRGGEVRPNNPPLESIENENPIARHFPEQNMLLNAAKMRISNYLSQLSPKKNIGKLPFDGDRPQPSSEKEYNHAVLYAARPLEILNDLKKGTLTSSKMKHFTSLYPEVYDLLSKKMTKKITDYQLDGGKRPPYALRQSLSLFLGSNLDSSLTPQSMQLAQASYIKSNAQSPQMKGSKAGLNKASDDMFTGNQAREQRSIET